ncbi:hypothetical protein ACT1UH_00200 [Mycoplasma sp. 332]|uniref:hypothetical protein n=1 Tax=Mycoplasma sp. 332 TaxID=3458236 RepID=UPI004035DD0D
MHEIELNYFQLNRKRKLDVITTYSNLTNKQLSLKAKCSISTIKRLKQKLRNAKLCKKEVNLAHGNQWGDRKKIYSNDLIINYGKKYESEKLIAGTKNSSCNSYMSYRLFYERIANVKISYSQLTRRLTQSGFLSAFAHKNTIKRQKTFVKKYIPYKPNILPKEKIAKPTIISKRKLVNMGECVELDGSIHFYVDQTLWTIVACIDVSTSKVLSLYFDEKAESVKGYQIIIQDMINKYGIPKVMISDNRMNFHNNLESSAILYDAVTKLGTEFITTSVSNEKPHIESFWRIAHNRIPIFLKDRNIKTNQDANKYRCEIIAMLNDIKTRKSITDSEKNEFRKPNSATLEAYFDLPIKRQIFNGIVTFKNKKYIPKNEKNQKIKVTSKNDATFMIGANQQYYFHINNKRYKAFELNENDIQMYEKIAYSKKLPLEISVVKKIVKHQEAGYYYNQMLSKKTEILESFVKTGLISQREIDLMRSINEDLEKIRRDINKIVIL